ncbi:hypothetical protein HYS00_01420 [Candidatus Microgenomates bacterium]|nr:hypothetical protein [Candidatus Microgenomates bacterium]
MKSIRRTPYQSFASFLILLFTLFMALFFFSITSYLNGVLSYFETKPQVTAYFQTNVKEGDIMNVKKELESSGKTKDIRYTSKNDALKIYHDLNKNNPLLLEMVSSDILPASLEVFAKQPEQLSSIANYLKKQPGIDEVVYQQNVVDNLLKLTTTIRRVSLLVVGVILFIAIIVLMTTTAFKIALKKDEIELLQLLGASNFYIRKPFLTEGIFFGWISGSTAFLIFYAIFFYFYPFLKSYMGTITDIPLFGLAQYNLYVWPPNAPFILLTYILTVLFGMLIGIIGNYLATSKYIK